LKSLSGTLLEYEFNSLVDSTTADVQYDDFEIYVTHTNGVSWLVCILVMNSYVLLMPTLGTVCFGLLTYVRKVNGIAL